MSKGFRSLILCAALAGATPASAGLILNGGFENGACGAGNSLGSGGCNTASLPGWTLDSGVNWYQDGFVDQNSIGLRPRSGLFAVNLGDGSVRTIQPTPFLLNQRYQLSFWVGTYAANAGDGAVLAQISDGTSNTIQFGEVLPRPAFGDRWERLAFSFIGDGTSNTIQIGEQPGLPYRLSYLGLDDVQVSAVPEASTWMMMLLGLAGLAFAGTRVSSSPSPAGLRQTAASARR